MMWYDMIQYDITPYGPEKNELAKLEGLNELLPGPRLVLNPHNPFKTAKHLTLTLL